MSAAEVLRAARAAGIQIELDRDDLVLAATVQPPAPLLDLLSRHKTGIITLLSTADARWSAEDWQIYFDERSGIAEFDGGLPRRDAEARAFESCVVRWLELHPATSEPDRCAWCGKADAPGNVVPFGAEPKGHVWLHHRCWRPWHSKRREEAKDALRAMGLAAGP